MSNQEWIRRPISALALSRRRVLAGLASLTGLALIGRSSALGRQAQGNESEPPPTGRILLADNFSDPSNRHLPATSTNPDKTAVGYLNGEYKIAVVDATYPLGAMVAVPGTYSDTTIDVDVRMLPQSKPQAAFYVRARGTMTADGYSGYSLGIYPVRGAFSLARVDAGPDSRTASITNLLGEPALRVSAAIKRGSATNHVQLTCHDDAISVSINDQLVASIRDDKLRSGRITLAAAFGTGGRQEHQRPIDVRIANLVVSKPA